MRVFVGVDVSDADSGLLEFLNLSESLAFDLLLADFAAQECLEEVDERGTKGFAIGAEECGDGFRWGDGNAIGEEDVTAYA
jgi:hypothetical protein